MSRDGAGNYTLPVGNPVASGTVIQSVWANNTLNDVAVALTNSLSRTGQGGMLAPFYFSDGTEQNPAASFTNDQTSGLYRASTADIRMSISGNDRMRWLRREIGPPQISVVNSSGVYVWENILSTSNSQTTVTVGTSESQTLRWDNTALTWIPNNVFLVGLTGATLDGTGGLLVRNGPFVSNGAGANSFRAGIFAGETNQAENAIAIGNKAGNNTQGISSIAIGFGAGETEQKTDSVAIGLSSGGLTQNKQSVAVGSASGSFDQGENAVAIGYTAGVAFQKSRTVAVGSQSGNLNQATLAVAVGFKAANSNQGENSVAIGCYAGQADQGSNSVAIGPQAGFANQSADSIMIGSGPVGTSSTIDGAIKIKTPLASLEYDPTDECWQMLEATTERLKVDDEGLYINGIKLTGVLNAVSLGAIGDSTLDGGGTDDTAAFQAMDSAYAGQTIDLLNLNYNIDDRKTNAYKAIYQNGTTYDSTEGDGKRIRSAWLSSNLVSNETALWIGSDVGTQHKTAATFTRWSTKGATNSVGVGINVLKNLTNGTLNIGSGVKIMPEMKYGRYNVGFGSNTHVYQDNQYYIADYNDEGNTADTELGARNNAFGVNTYRFSRHGYRNCAIGRNTAQDVTAEVKWDGTGFRKLLAGENGANGFPTYKVDPITTGDMGGHHIVAMGDGAMSGDGPVGIDGVIVNDWPMFEPNQTVIGGLAGKYTNFEGNTLIGANAGYTINANQATAVGYNALKDLGKNMFWNGNELVSVASQSCSYVVNTGNNRYLDLTTPSGFPTMAPGWWVRLTGQDIANLWVRVMSQSGNTLVVDTDGDASAASSHGAKTCEISTYANLTPAVISYGVTAIGDSALEFATYANYCTAVGHNSLQNNSGGNGRNVALGWRALQDNTTGEKNTALGTDALKTNTTFTNCTGVGYAATVTQSNHIQMGNNNVSLFTCAVAPSIGSDISLKENIVLSMGLDFINDLNPVKFHRKTEEKGKTEHGVIAQELLAALVTHCPDSGMVDDTGEVLGVRLTDLIAPLIRSVQELSEKVARLES